jgi:serine/threonine protein kinase/WD40 repeat protein
MNEPENRKQAIFGEAMEIADAKAREAFLSKACGADQLLRQEVEELLQAEAQAGRFLPDQPLGLSAALVHLDAQAAPQAARAEQIGDRIGRYKLLQRIGEGGCGIVYMAEQDQPVRRKVAVKVIKFGMDTRSVVARFEAERQALALMDHPSIAKVLDVGATESGRPYFVMELVRGHKITQYCDEQRFSTRQRLALFIQVCHAVQHAHQKGVIHRDLKPSNILVTENDGVPVPKVIDFGIAKATTGRLTDQTLFTAFEQFLGTPAYMSPEQAAMTSLDIDTRSDIYSLGVLLYELLTSMTPFDTKALLAAGLDELRRTIREEEPVRPSTRLSTMLAGDRITTAKLRRTEAPKLINLLRGDLDWIVMKCLEKDRTRRYETANGLAADITRHLSCEPVIARPRSWLYEFQKTVRRHKTGFAATCSVIAAMAIGLGLTTLEAKRARRAEREQIHLRQQAQQEAKNARRAEEDAKEKLWSSYLAQAQAGRWSHRAGRRFEGLELLKKASQIRPSLELRNEAIACMALPDLRLLPEINIANYETICFDPRYERYAANERESIYVCRAADSSVLLRLPGYESPVVDLQFSPDGRLLAVACGGAHKRLEIRDLDRNEVVFNSADPNFRCLAFNGDTTLAAISYDQQKDNWPVVLVDLKLGKRVASFCHGSLPYYLRFHPKQFTRLLTSDHSSVVRLWDSEAGRLVQSFTHPDWVVAIDWHPEGNMFATGCADGKVRLWDPDTGKEIAALSGHEWVPIWVTFSSDGEFLASRGWEGILRLWNPYAQREVVNMPVHGFTGPFGKTVNRFWENMGPGRMGILEAASGQGYRLLRSGLPLNDRGVCCDFSPNGRLLVTTHQSGFSLWDVQRGKELASVSKPRWYHHAKFHPDGRLFVSAEEGLEEWLVQESANENQSILTQRGKIPLPLLEGGLWFSSDGGTLAAATQDALHILDVKTAQERIQLPSSDGPPVFGALSADGRFAATYKRTGGTNVQIWAVAHSNLVHEVPTHLAPFVLFSPDNEQFVVGDEREYRVWTIDTWQSRYSVAREAAGHYGYVAMSPDGRLLAVAYSRTKVKLLAAATGDELATLEGPERMDVQWFAFNGDGSQLAVQSASAVQVWDLGLIRRELAGINLNWELPLLAGPIKQNAQK